MLSPATCTSTVLWPTQVTSISSPATARGGTLGWTGTLSGQAGRSVLSQRLKMRLVSSRGGSCAPGLKKRCPS